MIYCCLIILVHGQIHSIHSSYNYSEGGMVCSNNEEIISVARSIAFWGRDCYCVGSANLLKNGTCGNRFDDWLPQYKSKVDPDMFFKCRL